MNETGMNRLMSDKVTIGGEAAARCRTGWTQYECRY
jgi:hypothetical protein